MWWLEVSVFETYKYSVMFALIVLLVMYLFVLVDFHKYKKMLFLGIPSTRLVTKYLSKVQPFTAIE